MKTWDLSEVKQGHIADEWWCMNLNPWLKPRALPSVGNLTRYKSRHSPLNSSGYTFKFKLPIFHKPKYLARKLTTGSGAEEYGLKAHGELRIHQLTVVVKKVGVMWVESPKSQWESWRTTSKGGHGLTSLEGYKKWRHERGESTREIQRSSFYDLMEGPTWLNASGIWKKIWNENWLGFDHGSWWAELVRLGD